jgi:hypothetical protein
VQVRNYEVYRVLEESIKVMQTSLPLVQVSRTHVQAVCQGGLTRGAAGIALTATAATNMGSCTQLDPSCVCVKLLPC